MQCPQCNTEDHGAPTITSTEDKINKYGRQQITINVEIEDYISYHPETKTFHCSKCGHTFTQKEAFLQGCHTASTREGLSATHVRTF